MVTAMKKSLMLIVTAVGFMSVGNGYAEAAEGNDKINDLVINESLERANRESRKILGIFGTWTGLGSAAGMTWLGAKFGNWSRYDAAKVARVRRYAVGTNIVASLPISSLALTMGASLTGNQGLAKVVFMPFNYMVIKPARVWQEREDRLNELPKIEKIDQEA